MTFQETIRPWLLTPRLARPTRRRGPNLFLSPVGYLMWIMCVGMFYMTAYALTLTWDFMVIFYVGIGYGLVRLVRRLHRRPEVV